MKITIIGPVTPYRGGIAHFTTLLAAKLIETGHDLQVISFKKQYPAWLYPGESDKDHSPGRLKIDARFILSPLNPRSWRKALKLILDFNPKQVIFPWWVTFWGPAFHFLIKRLQRPSVTVSILVHNTLPHEPRAWDRFLAREALKDANRFIVMTEKEKQRLRKLLPKADEIILSPHPIFPSNDKIGLSKSEARQHLNLPLNCPFLLFFGIIRPYKGLGILLQAFSKILQQQPDTHLLVVGECWEDQSKYLSLIQSLNIADHIHIVDHYIPDREVSAYFKAADVFIAPYIGGTQSGAVKLALGYGLPVVTTDVINDEIIKWLPDRCVIVPSENPSALAEGILEGLTRPIQNHDQVRNLVKETWRTFISRLIGSGDWGSE